MENMIEIGLEGDELHQRLGGGIPTGSIMLVESLPSIGKSIFSQRLAYGALENGASVSYISTELSVTGFMKQMDSLRYDVKSKFFSEKLKVVSLFHPLKKTDLNENIFETLLGSKKLLDSDVIILDTFSEIIVKKKIDFDKSFEILSKLKKITSTGKSIILCVDPSFIKKELIDVLRRVSEVYVLLEERELYGNTVCYIVVKRFLRAKLEVEKEIAFQVRAGIGIVLDIAT